MEMYELEMCIFDQAAGERSSPAGHRVQRAACIQQTQTVYRSGKSALISD